MSRGPSRERRAAPCRRKPSYSSLRAPSSACSCGGWTEDAAVRRRGQRAVSQAGDPCPEGCTRVTVKGSQRHHRMLPSRRRLSNARGSPVRPEMTSEARHKKPAEIRSACPGSEAPSAWRRHRFPTFTSFIGNGGRRGRSSDACRNELDDFIGIRQPASQEPRHESSRDSTDEVLSTPGETRRIRRALLSRLCFRPLSHSPATERLRPRPTDARSEAEAQDLTNAGRGAVVRHVEHSITHGDAGRKVEPVGDDGAGAVGRDAKHPT